MAELKPYPEYKDSGVEWIGEIPEDWETSKIKYLTVLNNETLSDKTDPEIIIEYIDIGGVDSTGKIVKERMSFGEAPSRARRILRKNDIIISTVRTYLKAIGTISEEEDNLICSTGFAVITPREINSNYLSYLLHSHIYIDQIVSRSVGVSYPAINSSEIGRLNCILPPKLIQDNIAQYLNQKTSGINRINSDKNRLIKLLEEKRQAIITETVTKGLDPNVKMKDSGIEWIGEIPENWEITPIKWLTSIKRGASPRPIDDPKYFDEKGNYNWVRIADVSKTGMYLYDTSQKLSELGSSLSVKLNPGQLFVSIAGSVGKPCITKVHCCIHDGFVYFPEYKHCIKYLYYIFKSERPYQGLGKMGTELNLNTETIGSIRIPLPPYHEQSRISSYIEETEKTYNKMISDLKLSIKKLKEYRESLIYEAVTGKIDLREYEINSSEYTTYEQVAESDEAYMKSD